MPETKLQVGMKVHSKYFPEQAGVIRTLLTLTKDDQYESGYRASADGGEPCPACGRPLGMPIPLIGSNWFQSASKKKVRRIKDLPKGIDLRGVQFKHPKTGEKVYWYSQWEKGVWYKMDMSASSVDPLFVNDIKDALEFEVVDRG